MPPFYPLVNALVRQTPSETPRCLPAPQPSSLVLLQVKPLDPYLKRLMPEVGSYLDKMMDASQLSINLTTLVSIEIRLEIANTYSSLPLTTQVPLPSQIREGTQVPKQQPHMITETKNVKEAVVLLDFAILYNNLILRYVKSVLEDIDEITDKAVKTLKELKENLINYTIMLDEILLHYIHCREVLPKFENVNRCKAEIQRIVSQMNPEDLSKMLPQEVEASQEDIVCAAIGLNSQQADELKNLNIQFRDHQPDSYYLCQFVTDNIQSCDNCANLNTESNAVLKILLKAGFTESRAKILTEWIFENNLNKQQTLNYWVKWYLTYMFEYDLLLNDDCPRYRLHEKAIDEWKEIERDAEESEGSCSLPRVHIINTTIDKAYVLSRNGFKFPPEKAQANLWYHGTLHKSAEDIMYNGIHLGVGSLQQDFSHGDGFYLTPNYGYALDWARGKGPEAAVVVFEIDLTKTDFQEMDLSERNQDWNTIVKYNRSGRNKHIIKLPTELKREFVNCSYVKGPMGTGTTNFTEWVPRVTGSKEMHICIRSPEMAEVLDNHISAVIFVNMVARM